MKVNLYDIALTDEQVEKNVHREFVGGMWEELGRLQADFLISEGLNPDMKLLDIGCGCLRGGVHLIRFLQPGNYYGLDINESLLQAGYDVELLRAGLQGKLPRSNLLHENNFCASRLGVNFDMMLLQSVFTHLPLNHIRKCLIEMAKCISIGGKMYASFFKVGGDYPIENEYIHQPGGIKTYSYQDPYHYMIDDFVWAIQGLPWKIQYHGEWSHPRGQKMIVFIRGS